VLRKKKHTRKNLEAPPDVAADDPKHAMAHFTEGLRRVLATPKSSSLKRKRPR
jgi:hypothetical protein